MERGELGIEGREKTIGPGGTDLSLVRPVPIRLDQMGALGVQIADIVDCPLTPDDDPQGILDRIKC
jgi:hypothetical protein